MWQGCQLRLCRNRIRGRRHELDGGRNSSKTADCRVGGRCARARRPRYSPAGRRRYGLENNFVSIVGLNSTFVYLTMLFSVPFWLFACMTGRVTPSVVFQSLRSVSPEAGPDDASVS